MDEPHFELFFFYISGVYRDIQRLRAQFAEAAGVKAVHIFWVYLLKEHEEGLTAAELAEASQTTSSLVSREITELAAQAYIYADELSDKRRYGWRFHLTEKGRALAAEIDRVAMNVQSFVNKDISPDELKTFYRVLTKLSDGFRLCQAPNASALKGDL